MVRRRPRNLAAGAGAAPGRSDGEFESDARDEEANSPTVGMRQGPMAGPCRSQRLEGAGP